MRLLQQATTARRHGNVIGVGQCVSQPRVFGIPTAADSLSACRQTAKERRRQWGHRRLERKSVERAGERVRPSLLLSKSMRFRRVTILLPIRSLLERYQAASSAPTQEATLYRRGDSRYVADMAPTLNICMVGPWQCLLTGWQFQPIATLRAPGERYTVDVEQRSISMRAPEIIAVGAVPARFRSAALPCLPLDLSRKTNGRPSRSTAFPSADRTATAVPLLMSDSRWQ
jgi:hypothetical protein